MAALRSCAGKVARATMLSLTVLIALGPPARGETAGIPRYENTNVILISIDTLRNDHLGCYGYQRSTSENIDAVARQGVVFDNFITQAALTPISQMSILSSQDPRVNGMDSYESPVDAVTDRTLPQILKYYGYTNAAFLGCPEFYRSKLVQDKAASGYHKEIFGKAFDVFSPSEERSIPREALPWIESHKDEKFFLWIPIGTVHRPFTRTVPPPFNARFDQPGYTPFFSRLPGGNAMPQSGVVTSPVLSRIYQKVYYGSGQPYNLTEEDVQYIIGRYDAGISYADMFVGEVMSLLERLHLSGKTVVLLHSIHGEDLGEHGYFYHYDIYDTEVKNALIIKFPGERYGGKRIATQAQGLDILPTLLDYLGIPVNHEAQGVSLMPVIENEATPGVNEFAYTSRIPLWEYLLFRGQNHVLQFKQAVRPYLEKYDPQYPPNDIAVRTNEWKLILRRDRSLLEKISWWAFVSRKKVPSAEVELYDLKSDPFELKNVASERPDVVVSLKARLLAWDDLIERRKAGSVRNGERFIIPYP